MKRLTGLCLVSCLVWTGLAKDVVVMSGEALTNGLFGVSCEQADAVYARGDVPLVVMRGSYRQTETLKKVLIPDYCVTNGSVVAKVNMAEALELAGFEAYVLPFTEDNGEIDLAIGGMDALMVAGGWAGQDYPRRCEFEHRVIRAALRRGLPVAGVCHGSQIINTYFGGTLKLTPQKLGEKDFLIAHRMPVRQPYTDNFHLADLEPGSRIARVLGSGRVVINSSHSNRSFEMGKGLKVTGRALDGVVEAFEHETLPIMAFQFHPERMVYDGRFVELIRESLSVRTGVRPYGR